MRKCYILYTLLLSMALISTGWSQSVFDQKIADLMQQVSRDSLTKHIESLTFADGHETRTSYTEGNRWASSYIFNVFQSYAGLTSVEFDTFFAASASMPFDTEPLVNVVATLEGNKNPSQVYIIGGHLDATGNLDQSLTWNTDWPTAKAHGADDNASGVAATLEIARVLSDPQNNFSPDFTIKFIALGAEERHPAYNNENHLGSKHFVEEAFGKGEEILGAHILDMIGYNSTGNDYFNIVSNNKSTSLGENMLDVNLVYQVGLESNSPPFPEASYSDHEQFWLYRYPAILIIENAPPWENSSPWYTSNPFYHRESDTFSTLNMNQVHKVAQLGLATIASISGPVTSVASHKDLPLDFALFGNYPNPFNAGTRISYQLKSRGEVSLAIYNLRGQQVGLLVDEIKPSGNHEIVWDGRDKQGRSVPSGVFLYRLQVGGRQRIHKMILIK